MSNLARKTRDEYDVEGGYGYGHGFEAVTCEATLREARARMAEYRANEPGVPFRIRRRRVRLEPAPERSS